LQYTPRGGDVIVETILNNTDVLITVKDNGIGISKEDLPLLFDRFYRADKARTRMEGGGSGIGLTISKQIMEAHGGRLWVESPGKGKGSTFFIRIPLQSIDGQKKDEG
jgi:signal transduction histidine kinase